MRIVVAGGAGAMALPAIIHILEQKDVTEIIVADLDKTKVDKRIKDLGDKRLEGQVFDLMDVKTSAKSFRGAEAVLNAAYMDTCLVATEAALEAGVNYVDLGALEIRDQLKLHKCFFEKGITGVLGVGGAPGMSNMMAAYLVDRLDAVDTIEIKDVCADLVPHDEHSRALYWGYAIDAIIEEFSQEAPVLENGEIKYYPPRSFPETVPFRPPWGPRTVSITAHPEVGMFAQSFKDKGLRNASWKIAFEPEFEKKMRFLCDLGFGRKEPINVGGQMVSPKTVLLTLLNNQPPETKKPPDFRSHMIMIVKGKQGGQTVEYAMAECTTPELTEKMRESGAQGSYKNGTYAAVVTMMLARGQIQKKGAFYPEKCIPPDLFMREVVRAGIDVEVNKKVSIEP